MNLRSKKAPMKADIISTFHDVLLIHILSFLPLPDAHRTRVLSSSWKNLWALLPVLHIVMPFCWTDEEVNRFHDSVDQTLDLRGGMPIQRFYLCCSKNCSYDRVYGWLRKVVQCKVQELELRFPADRFIVRFCWDLFKTCTTLVSLTLGGEFVLIVPHEAEILFPCLKTINLISIVYCCNKCFKNLICACPVLEELFVERQLLNGKFDDMRVFEVLSPSLKRLRLSFALSDVTGDFRVVIDAPNLEYLKILDYMTSNYSLANTLKLTEAHVHISQARPATQFVQHLSSVKTLTLTHMTLMALSKLHGFNIPTFPNLVKFVIGIKATLGWRILPFLLNNMPNLEHITFSDVFVPCTDAQDLNMRWNQPAEAPACLCFKIKEIIIDNQDAISPQQFKLLRYLLKHAKNLEILTMNAYTIDTRKREQVLKIPRGSKSCQIQFV